MKESYIKVWMMIAILALFSSPVAQAQSDKDLPDVQYYGYKIVHHMGAVVEHIEKFGFNKFDHPRIADYRSFVITPALDHFYSKAVADVRFGPVIIDTPAKDDRYSSLEIFDVEHHAIYDKVTAKDGERFVLVHEDYNGKPPKGAVIKTTSNFPFVFIRTQSFAFNTDKLANSIRHEARMYGLWESVELPNPKDTQALIRWTIANSKPYPQTKALMAEAAKIHTPAVHKETFENLKAFLASGGVSGNVGMFEPVDHPAGGTHKVRAAGTLLGHLGFPVHHAYYQQLPVDSTGKKLAGANGPFVLTLPYKPGVDLFWSVTRYGADTFLPLNPADLGGNDIQAYNAFNTKPDKNGNVTFTFSKKDPKDGTYWMPVMDSGYYILARYYGPTKRLNGNTAKDIIYGGTKLEKKFKTVKFK
ncbi:MAG: DUF1254 domain-containing protein [Deltaproteobacteria bacterium]|nr:DUF1254 domain-containing protein [Deltaproteobacteria bacterium]